MLRRARRWRRCRARWWRARAARRRGPCAAPAAARSRACGPPRWRAAWRRSRRPRGRTRSCSACSKPSRISSIYTIDNSRYSLLSLCFHWLLGEKLEENKKTIDFCKVINNHVHNIWRQISSKIIYNITYKWKRNVGNISEALSFIIVWEGEQYFRQTPKETTDWWI